MGSVSSNPNADETGTISNLPMHLRRMELKFEITKDVNPNLKQLLHSIENDYYWVINRNKIDLLLLLQIKIYSVKLFRLADQMQASFLISFALETKFSQFTNSFVFQQLLLSIRSGLQWKYKFK